MRLEISSAALTAIRRSAAAAHPREACGLLFGDSNLIDDIETTANVADDPETGFEIDPSALFGALRAERAGGRCLIGYWHSHPSGSVKPSGRDLDSAQPDGRLWLIVAGDDVAAWRAVEREILDQIEHAAELNDGHLVEVVRYSSSGATSKAFDHVPMWTGEIRHLIPRDKCDVAMVPMIAEAGYPAIAPILDELMPWTADPNWPVAVPLIDHLTTLGDAMVEPIRHVLRGDDDRHKLVWLRVMRDELPGMCVKLREELAILGTASTTAGEGADVADEARAILADLSGRAGSANA